MRAAAIKAGKTGRWAKIMAKWVISYLSRGGRKWHLISFDGPTGAEASGIVDFIAIRKDFSTPEETL
ncbi:MAG TPA: hypothetical protein VKU80_08645, partial [Planctomycetota bacterium]|nr:hypothetical protein [Planctomycetota bacterium]